MRKILYEAESARSHHLPNSKSVIWQQITSGKHYSHEFDPRNILKPWDQVITEIAEKAAKVHYKDSKILGKIKRIHVDQGIDKNRGLTTRPWIAVKIKPFLSYPQFIEPKRITIPNF